MFEVKYHKKDFFDSDIKNNHVWLKEFEKKKGRPLRVLHVGNIANNAYLNAKYQRLEGIHADVISGDAYHIMSCPEWEELDISEYGNDDFFPIFDKKNIGRYKRPKWFAQGPFVSCCYYLRERFKGNRFKAYVLRKLIANSTKSNFYREASISFSYCCNIRLNLISQQIHKKIKKSFSVFLGRKKIPSLELTQETAIVFRKRLMNNINIWAFHKFFIFSKNKIKKILLHFFSMQNAGSANLLCHRFKIILKDYLLEQMNLSSYLDYDKIVNDFNNLFPKRKDKLTKEDVLPYKNKAVLRELSCFYDIVQCYGVEPIWAMLAGIENYVAFEHGTLRVFVFENDPLSRLNSLAYRKAKHVFVTNGDCLENAKKLEIENFSGIAHPLEGNWPENKTKISTIRQQLNSDIILFSPMRHDWAIKGNDVVIYAIKKIKDITKKTVKVIFTEWGQEVDRSKKLIEQIGCQENVLWSPPMCRKRMIETMQIADIILDQMILPCFGGIVPQALSVGTPVVMSYDHASTEWLFKEAPPILIANNAEDIVQAVIKATDKKWRNEYKKIAMKWFEQHHHIQIAVNQQITVYQKIVENSIKC